MRIMLAFRGRQAPLLEPVVAFWDDGDLTGQKVHGYDRVQNTQDPRDDETFNQSPQDVLPWPRTWSSGTPTLRCRRFPDDLPVAHICLCAAREPARE